MHSFLLWRYPIAGQPSLAVLYALLIGTLWPVWASQNQPKIGVTVLDTAEHSIPIELELSSQRGTVMFWIKPHRSIEGESRTLLSAKWISGSYFAVSEGWWEPAGADRFYLIVSNEDQAHCSAPYSIPDDQWTHITAQWTSDRCLLFINNQLLARNSLEPRTTQPLNGPMVLGSDRPTPIAKNRHMSAEFRGLEVARYAVPAAERLAHAEDTAPGELADRSPRDDSRPLVDRPSVRLVFDEGPNWLASSSTIRQRINKVASNGFTVYMPTLWHGGGSYVRSPVMPLAPGMAAANANRDILLELTNAATRSGISVHPSFTVGHYEGPLAASELAPYANTDKAFDLRSSEFRERFVSMLEAVVRDYPIQGVNLDYVRIVEWCRSQACEMAYSTEMGTSLVDDLEAASTNDVARNRLREWAGQSVAGLLALVSTRLRKIRPDLIISVATHAQTDMSDQSLQGRNAALWSHSGWVDWVLDMQYTGPLEIESLRRYKASLDPRAKYIPLLSVYENDPLTDKRQPRPTSTLELQFGALDEHTAIGLYLYNLITEPQWRFLGDRFSK